MKNIFEKISAELNKQLNPKANDIVAQVIESFIDALKVGVTEEMTIDEAVEKINRNAEQWRKLMSPAIKTFKFLNTITIMSSKTSRGHKAKIGDKIFN